MPFGEWTMRKAAVLKTIRELTAATGMRSTMIGQRVLDFLTQSIAEGIMYPTSCVSVAIEDEGLYLAKVSRFLLRTRIAHISEHRLEGSVHLQPEALASTLSVALKDLRATKKGIALVIPHTWALMRTTELPASVRDNMCDVVSFELDRLTPFAAKDAFYDFRIIGENAGKIGLAIFAAKADCLNTYMKAFREHGIAVASLTPTTSLLDQDEVRRRLHIADGGAGIPYHALGAALDCVASRPQGINLLAKGQKARRRVPVELSVVLLLILMILSVLYIRAPLGYESRRLKEIERQIGMRKEAAKKTGTLRKEVETLGKEIATVDDFKEKRPMVLAVLKELTGVLPKSAWLTRARVTDSTVELEGYASSASEILPRLEQSKYLRKVEFASPTIRDQRMNADRFVMKMEIEGFATKTEEGRKNEKE